MRSRQRGWVMPEEDIPSVLRMIEEKITSSKIKVHHRDSLVRLKDILEEDLEAVTSGIAAPPERNQEAA